MAHQPRTECLPFEPQVINFSFWASYFGHHLRQPAALGIAAALAAADQPLAAAHRSSSTTAGGLTARFAALFASVDHGRACRPAALSPAAVNIKFEAISAPLAEQDSISQAATHSPDPSTIALATAEPVSATTSAQAGVSQLDRDAKEPRPSAAQPQSTDQAADLQLTQAPPAAELDSFASDDSAPGPAAAGAEPQPAAPPPGAVCVQRGDATPTTPEHGPAQPVEDLALAHENQGKHDAAHQRAGCQLPPGIPQPNGKGMSRGYHRCREFWIVRMQVQVWYQHLLPIVRAVGNATAKHASDDDDNFCSLAHCQLEAISPASNLAFPHESLCQRQQGSHTKLLNMRTVEASFQSALASAGADHPTTLSACLHV